MTVKWNNAMAWLRILCAVLLVSAGLAHRPLAAQPLPPQGIAVYVLPDGSLADLCVPGDYGQKGKLIWHGCEACRIASSILIPEPPIESASIERTEIATDFASVRPTPAALPFHAGASPRGPPEFFA